MLKNISQAFDITEMYNLLYLSGYKCAGSFKAENYRECPWKEHCLTTSVRSLHLTSSHTSKS